MALRLFAIAIFELLFFSQSSFAQAPQQHPEVKALADTIFLMPDVDIIKPGYQTSAIIALQNYCQALGNAFPKNSPAEERWLDDELTGDNQRLMRALNSAEMGRRQTDAFIRDCKTATSTYLQSDGNKAQSIFMLIFSISRFHAEERSRWAQQNGLDPQYWGFNILSLSVSKLSLLGASMSQSAILKGWKFGLAPATK
jgi:hypothetical protein